MRDPVPFNLYLIGFMGCGKSTAARFLAQAYGMRRVEMDEEIEKEENMTIPAIFAQKGEEWFRQRRPRS